jgi:triosephosphate isomerase
MAQREEARTPFVAGNWKMHKLRSEARAFAEALATRIDELDEVDLAVAPTFLCLSEVADVLAPLGVGVLGQNGHAAPTGAFTGEVSMTMLVDAGATGVLLGHSERRQYFGEDDEALAEKVPAALAAGLEPILCVGESEEERERDETQRKLRIQVQEALERVPDERLTDVVIAYEPIWAIGTGKVATPEIAQDAIAFIRALVGDRSEPAAERIRILYGGSVKPDNAAEILAQPDVDGALVGGASLDPKGLVEIASAAAL